MSFGDIEVQKLTGVFDNRVLKGIFGPKMDEVRGEWRKLHIEEINILHSSPNVFLVINSGKMRWVGVLNVW
jgi:hypothetical protein